MLVFTVAKCQLTIQPVQLTGIKAGGSLQAIERTRIIGLIEPVEGAASPYYFEVTLVTLTVVALVLPTDEDGAVGLHRPNQVDDPRNCAHGCRQRTTPVVGKANRAA